MNPPVAAGYWLWKGTVEPPSFTFNGHLYLPFTRNLQGERLYRLQPLAGCSHCETAKLPTSNFTVVG